MSKIAANSVVVLIGGKQIAGATDAELSLTTAMISGRCKGDAAPHDEPDHVEWSINSSNMTGRETGAETTLADLQTAVTQGLPLKVTFKVGELVSYEGTVIVTSLSVNAPDGEKITASVTLKGNSDLTKVVAA